LFKCWLFIAIGYLLADALGLGDSASGTDEATEMAAYALGAHDMGLTGGGIEGDGLMTTIATGYVTTATADALGAINLGPALLSHLGQLYPLLFL